MSCVHMKHRPPCALGPRSWKTTSATPRRGSSLLRKPNRFETSWSTLTKKLGTSWYPTRLKWGLRPLHGQMTTYRAKNAFLDTSSLNALGVGYNLCYVIGIYGYTHSHSWSHAHTHTLFLSLSLPLFLFLSIFSLLSYAPLSRHRFLFTLVICTTFKTQVPHLSRTPLILHWVPWHRHSLFWSCCPQVQEQRWACVAIQGQGDQREQLPHGFLPVCSYSLCISKAAMISLWKPWTFDLGRMQSKSTKSLNHFNPNQAKK